LKKTETKKYREAVCRLLECKFQQIDGDGNCFFAAISTCMAHFKENPLFISATELRASVVAWLVECEVCTPPLIQLKPPYTTLL
jgi:hypothetical protein